jgi:serine/threonine protein kinase
MRMRWALQCVEGLAYLHARDVVHGDVKSDNVLLHDAAAGTAAFVPTISATAAIAVPPPPPPPPAPQAGGWLSRLLGLRPATSSTPAPTPSTASAAVDWSRFTAKVSDLGGAALRREENAATADAAYFVERGSPAYMCPALALGLAPLSKASDVYSVGVLLGELLGGALPFADLNTSALPPPSAALQPAVDAFLSTAKMYCLTAVQASQRRFHSQFYAAVADGLRPLTPDQLAALQPRGVGSWIAAMLHPEPRMRPPLADVVEALRILLGGAAEELPRSPRDKGWAECFGVSAAAGGRTRVAAGLLAPVVAAAPAAAAPTAAALVPDGVAGAAGGMACDIMGTRLFGELSGHGTAGLATVSSSARPPPPPPAAPLPPGWVMCTDPSSGRPYYWHEASGTTTWERPG